MGKRGRGLSQRSLTRALLLGATIYTIYTRPLSPRRPGGACAAALRRDILRTPPAGGRHGRTRTHRAAGAAPLQPPRWPSRHLS